MVINSAEERYIKTIKDKIRDLNTTADAFILFSGNVSKEVFYKSFDRILNGIQDNINALKDMAIKDREKE